MAYIDHVQISGSDYEIRDARIIKGVLNFAGVTTSTAVVDKAPVVGDFAEGDIVINTTTGKEFIVVNVGTTTTPSLQWAEFGDATDQGGTALSYVTSTTSYQPAGTIGNTNTTITSTGAYTPAGSVGKVATTLTSTGSYRPAGTVNVVLPTATVSVVTGGVSGVRTKAQTIVTGGEEKSVAKTIEGTTTSANVVSSVATASKNVVSAVKTGSAISAAATASVDTSTHTLILGAAPTMTVVTGVTTAAQTMVTGVATAAQTIVTDVNFDTTSVLGSLTTASVQIPDTDEVTDLVSSVPLTSVTVVTGQPTTKTFTGTTATINVNGSYNAPGDFTGTAATISVAGTYSKATSFTGTTATITSTSTERFLKEARV